MKRKDSNMEIFKEWGSPRSNVQLFMPQEYCASCWEKVTTLSARKYLYIDRNGDTQYQSNERFTSGWNTNGRDALYDSVDIYYTTCSSSSHVDDNRTPPSNHDYSNPFTNTYTYTFHKIGSFDVKTDSGGIAYYKTGNAS